MALLITLATLGAMEAGWRAVGFPASVLDSLDLWAWHRARAVDGKRPGVVLLGASRMQLDFSSERFHARFPEHDLRRLSVVGTSPQATLFDLAADEAFHGSVICSMAGDSMLASQREDQLEQVRSYHDLSSVNTRLNAWIVANLQWRLRIFNARHSLLAVLKSLALERRLPRPWYTYTLPDRSRISDYSMLDIRELRRHRMESLAQQRRDRPPPDPATWLREAAPIEAAIRQIESRGGRVVLVRLPTTGEHWDADQRDYPREQYWDAFAAITSAETIHFQDVPGLRGYECPDASHLDSRDAGPFTDALLDELVRRGALEARGQEGG